MKNVFQLSLEIFPSDFLEDTMVYAKNVATTPALVCGFSSQFALVPPLIDKPHVCDATLFTAS
ncbi:hypothetical protein JYU34_012279 [Plutella xylostella]|uniref:Uncharacterized protein n=1 Tax=Plutella xylostella TaxID=51655 RepID=A0ABQ7QES9_PLUXY|nr:hypothetical protein JYU34_012279 [Plutella xylostella]